MQKKKIDGKEAREGSSIFPMSSLSGSRKLIICKSHARKMKTILFFIGLCFFFFCLIINFLLLNECDFFLQLFCKFDHDIIYKIKF